MSDQGIEHLTLSPDGNTLGTMRVSRGFLLTFHSADTGKWINTYRPPCMRYAGFLPGGDVILERRGPVGFIRWNPESGQTFGEGWSTDWKVLYEKPRQYRYEPNNPEDFALSPNGETLVVRSHRRLGVYDLRAIWPKGR